jgi:hypothetical protein
MSSWTLRKLAMQEGEITNILPNSKFVQVFNNMHISLAIQAKTLFLIELNCKNGIMSVQKNVNTKKQLIENI